MAYQHTFMKPLLELHKYIDQNMSCHLHDLNEALAEFLTTGRRSVKTEVHLATLAAALDITGYILNFKQHMRKVFHEIEEPGLLHALKCEEVIDILLARSFSLCNTDNGRMLVALQEAKVKSFLKDLVCISPPKVTVSI